MQSFYMIYCKKRDSGCFYAGCYYSRGIYIINIPFERYDEIQIHKITTNNNKKFVYDLYPAFYKFQKAIKLYYKICKNPKYIMKRETDGPKALPKFRKILKTLL